MSFDFDLDEYLKNKPDALSPLGWENYLMKKSSANPPKWLEDVGLDPTTTLSEGEFGNYLYAKAAPRPQRITDVLRDGTPFRRSDPFGSRGDGLRNF